jgi:hypothetical protein
MLEILRFVLSDFWTFIGAAILLAIVTEGASRILTFVAVMIGRR